MDNQIGTSLLLDCLKITVDEELPKTLVDLSPQDWEKLWLASAAHGLAPLLYYRFSELDLLQFAPPDILSKLRNTVHVTARRNILNFQQLGGVFDALNIVYIPSIALKGTHLAALVYDDPALRPMGDIDLMVREDDLQKTLELFTALGYRSHREFDIQDECTRMHHLPPLSGPGPISFELHWNISNPTYPFQIDPHDLWGRAQPATIAGSDCYVLSPEDLLNHLVLHVSYQHSFSLGLLSIYDISALLHRFQGMIDWKQVEQQACQTSLAKCLFLALSLASDFFAPPIPLGVLPTLQPEDFEPETLQMLKEHILSGRPQLTINLAELLETEPLPQKASRFLSRIFIPREVMAREYGLTPGSPALYLGYLTRAHKLLTKNAAEALKFARRDPASLSSAQRQNQISALHDWMGTP